MNSNIEKFRKSTESLRQQIIDHKVFGAIRSLNDLQLFMQYHVYAVWDFMSLLKALQNQLTCTSVPWFPKGLPDTRYLINEIVVGEESDVDVVGNRKSHFEIYLEAMQQCGADTGSITRFAHVLQSTGNFQAAYNAAETPLAAQHFVNYTFNIINSKKSYLQAAIFTFGREDLIPGMFHTIVNDLHTQLPNNISLFKYYLERHIEVDGDHHSQLALQMTASLCGDNQAHWNEAEQVTINCLQERIQLWDGVYQQLTQQQEPANTSIRA